jgi:hypothetical protein
MTLGCFDFMWFFIEPVPPAKASSTLQMLHWTTLSDLLVKYVHIGLFFLSIFNNNLTTRYLNVKLVLVSNFDYLVH